MKIYLNLNKRYSREKSKVEFSFGVFNEKPHFQEQSLKLPSKIIIESDTLDGAPAMIDEEATTEIVENRNGKKEEYIHLSDTGE